MSIHLVPTVEEFAAYANALAEEIGGWPLHPANRSSACGRRVGSLSVTTDPARATCKVCQKARPFAGRVR